MAGGYTLITDQPPATPEEEAAVAAFWQRCRERAAEERRRADARGPRYPQHMRRAANAQLSAAISGHRATGGIRGNGFAMAFDRPSTAAAMVRQQFFMQTESHNDEHREPDYRQEAEDDCQSGAGAAAVERAVERASVEQSEASISRIPSQAPSSPLFPAPSSPAQEQPQDNEHLPSQPQPSEPSRQSQEAQPTDTAAPTEVWARTAPNQPLGPRPPDHSRWYYVTEPALGKRKEEDRPIVEGKRKRKPKKSFGDP